MPVVSMSRSKLRSRASRIRRTARRWVTNLPESVASIPMISDAACPAFAPISSEWLLPRGYVSQIGQDYFLDQFMFGRRKGGVFVDVGAHDGITYSNTFFLERVRDWTGLCVEPNPEIFKRLSINRSCAVEEVAVGAHEGSVVFTSITGPDMLSGVASKFNRRHRLRIEREVSEHNGSLSRVLVPMRPLQTLLEEHGITDVDLLTIDTEGSELDVLQGLDLTKTKVSVILVERNYSSGSIPGYLKRAGFVRLMALGWDDVYLHKDLRALHNDQDFADNADVLKAKART